MTSSLRLSPPREFPTQFVDHFDAFCVKGSGSAGTHAVDRSASTGPRMERELDLMILILAVSGFATAVVGLIPVRRNSDARRSERALWRAITPICVVRSLAVVSGRRCTSPRCRRLRAPLLLFACARVCSLDPRDYARDLVVTDAAPTGACDGWAAHPLIVVSPSYAASIEPDILGAVVAHEAAHARHHDPLRIFIAQARDRSAVAVDPRTRSIRRLDPRARAFAR
jgi:hypothetical protein